MKKQRIWFACMHGIGASEVAKTIFDTYAPPAIKSRCTVHTAGFASKRPPIIGKNDFVVMVLPQARITEVLKGRTSSGAPMPEESHAFRTFKKEHKHIFYIPRPYINLNRAEATPEQKKLAREWIAAISFAAAKRQQTKTGTSLAPKRPHRNTARNILQKRLHNTGKMLKRR